MHDDKITMCYESVNIKCPHCKHNILANIVYIDDNIDPDFEGGETICEICGNKIFYDEYYGK